MNAQVATIRKFIAGTLQSDEELIQQFVVREGEFQIVLRTLANNVDAACCQHLLLIAPRGRGKTMMLARVAAETRANDGLSPHYLPIPFMEENQEIFSMGDFWLETLFHLAKAVQRHDAELAAELTRAHADFATRWQERDIVEHVRTAILGAADRIGKKLLLMVENLQSLSDYVDDDFGWQLREALQCEPQIVLLATATSRFTALDDAKEAFFELFRTINLEPLDTDSCRRLWQAISGEDLSSREVRPLQILTGGSPRFLVIMGNFSRHHSMRELLEQLVTLIDDHAEYFRSYSEALAKQERRVYLSVADLWQPSSTSEIAARARMDVRTASTLIGRLVNRGALIVHGSGRKQSYSVAERLYCIYYKLRRERDEAAVVHSLIRFMTAFYSGPEFASLVKKFRTEAIKHPAIREGLKRGGIEVTDLNQTLSTDDIANRLPDTSTQGHSTQSAGVPFNKALDLIRVGQHKDALDVYEKTVARFAGNDAPEVTELAAIALFNKGVTLGKLGRDHDEIAAYDEVIHRFADSGTPELMEQVAKALVNKGVTLGRLGRDHDEIAAYDEVIHRFADSSVQELMEQVAKALFNKGVTLGALGRYHDEIAAYNEVTHRFADNEDPELTELVAEALFNKGVTLGALGREDDEIAAYEEIVRRFSSSEASGLMKLVAEALFNKGVSLGELGREDDEIAAYEEIVRRFGGSDAPELMEQVSQALLNKGITLGKLGRDHDEMTTYNEIVHKFADSSAPELMEQVAKALFNKGVTLGALGREDEEIAAYEEIVRRFGSSDAPNLQETITTALTFKALAANQARNPDIALTICDDIDRRISPPTPNAVRSRWLRAEALVLLSQHPSAIRALEAAYEALDPSDSRLIPIASSCISNFVAAGADERRILEILTSDEARATSLLPLIVALRRRSGVGVQAPAEVHEVAKDLTRYIDERSNAASTAPSAADP